MGNFLFSAVELCSIIKTCGEAQVACLRIGDFSVHFDRPVELVPESSPWSVTKNVTEPLAMTENASSPAPAKAPAVPNHDEQTRAALETDEVRLREMQIEELTITDPLMAERLIAQGELTQDGTSAEDDEDL